MLELILPTMTCGHCVKAVTEAVKAIDAKARIDIDLAAHRLRIESQRDTTEFANALSQAGYVPA